MVFYFEINEDDLEKFGISTEEIQAILPNWDTKIKQIYKYENKGFYEVVLLISARSEEQIKLWLQDYEEKSKNFYSIVSTKKTTGMKVTFKQFLRCHFNTNRKKLVGKDNRSIRNTNCYSRIIITLKSIKQKKFRGKPINTPDKQFPCEIRLFPCHNHPTELSVILKHRPVAKATKEKLVMLFEKGHSAATAMTCLKIDLQATQENYQKALLDRSICPRYQDALHLYSVFHKKRNEEPKDSKLYLIEIVTKLNKTNSNSIAIRLCGNQYVICICTPLMRRVHEKITASSDMVFIDGSETSKHDSKVYILSTISECGSLPLGVLITSTETLKLLVHGFELLQQLVGKVIFGGKPEGPQLFLTEDNDRVQTALQNTWPKSLTLLCNTHFLQSLWRWLTKASNSIMKNEQTNFYKDFRNICFASTDTECLNMFQLALKRAAHFAHYYSYLQDKWQQKEQWALCCRPHLVNGTNLVVDAALRIVKDKIFEKIKKFNGIQVLDFMCNQFSQYYEKRLFDVANKRVIKCVNSDDAVVKIPENAICYIQVLTEEICLVPGINNSNITFTVNNDILDCSCISKRCGEKICKHIDLITAHLRPSRFQITIDNMELKRTYYFIASGRYPIQSFLVDSHENMPNDGLIETITIFMEEEDRKIDHSYAQTMENIVKDGNEIITNMSQELRQFLQESPEQVFLALKMLESKIKGNTSDDFVVFCNNLFRNS
ncbi:hypothetical protein ABEB36_005591 [Hypothenemus hampei]|uniref:SWIM-type domain-containing protein n=1 Tax=Hypothenemus hampei TaxID=57062 RepID=A0ABD1EYS7_HYPHA